PARARDIAVAARHGALHPADVHAHGLAHRHEHEVTHGPAEPHDDGHAGTSHGGHGAWHGPHEAPTPMMFPLMVLALGSIIAGFGGVPKALGGTNAIERFLEPSFTPSHVAVREGAVSSDGVGARAESGSSRTAPADARAPEHGPASTAEPEAAVSWGVEI